MKNIFLIFRSDIRMIYRNIIAFVVIIGITILPALYSWFNIASNWDPYSATSGISFAVCNKDKGYSYKSIEINAGKQIADGLKSNDKMGWTFVDEKEAIDGVDSGKYYAAVVIPEKFSENLCSITTGEFEQSVLDYYVNEKKNAIAPKITNSGMNTIENEVKSAYVNTVTNVLATMLNITADEYNNDKEGAVKNIKESLTNITDEVDAFNTTCDVFISTLDTLDKLVKTNKDLLPSVSETLSKSGVITADVKSSIEATRNASAQISDAVGNILASADQMQVNINNRITAAFEMLEGDASGAAGELINITELNNKIISINSYVISILESIRDSFGVDVSSVLDRLYSANDHQQQLIDKLYSAAMTINTTSELPGEVQTEILNLVNSCKVDLSGIDSSFTSVKSTLSKTVDDVYDVLESASGLLQIVNGDIPTVDATLDSASQAITEMKNTFGDVKTLMNNSKKKIENLIKVVDEVSDGGEIAAIAFKIIEDPAALSTFFSDPVTTKTHSLHSVANYGSAMSPFYTSLGIWVGGIVLAAVLRAELTNSQISKLKRPRNYQMYFGRYILFFILAEMQSLIISLGDIYFLGIQCNNKFLFVLGSMISAFVYSIIIYSLTICFNVIGKALAVIILVLQVAGSGGTFPVEVLPAPFQSLVPYLPFRYGNDILREAIAGPDMSVYWHNVLMLLAFVPFALVVGILLRRPCIKLMHFFDKRIHQSDLII